MKARRDIRVAIVHDYLRTYGGGERVLEALHDIWPKAKIFVATADYERMGAFGDKFKKLKIKTSWAQKISIFVKKPLLYRFLLPFVWSSLDVGDVDVVISSSGSNISKGVKIPEGVAHVCYCHTPPRFLYSLETETSYLNNPFINIITYLAMVMLKNYDKKTSDNVDLFVANSQNVRSRIKKFYYKDADVVYPPCKLPRVGKKIKRGSYYLVVSRLVRYKNVDLIIKAFNKLKLPLKIVGTGRDESRLKKLASENIEFLGEVSDGMLYEAYMGCKALVAAAKDEDFGMTLGETMGYGKPVVAYNSGGYKELVQEAKTGVFFERLSAGSIYSAIKRLERINFSSQTIRKNAETFSVQKFKTGMKKAVEDGLKIKQKLVRLQLFGQVPFDVVSRKQLINNILGYQVDKKKKLILYMNSYGVVAFLKNSRYARIMGKADVIYPDGWGPVLASWFSKDKLIERVNVGDFIDELLGGMNNRGFGIYLLGCESATNTKTIEVIKRKYPKIRICGGYHGFLTRREEKEVVKKINMSRPNLVLVGMGLPDQEYFIARNWRQLPPAVYMGVGGVFYYIAGLKSRAPVIMRRYGLEWIYRFFQEPQRLWKRYTLDHIFFIRAFLRSLIKKN